jgi:hypothetical protein
MILPRPPPAPFPVWRACRGRGLRLRRLQLTYVAKVRLRLATLRHREAPLTCNGGLYAASHREPLTGSPTGRIRQPKESRQNNLTKL